MNGVTCQTCGTHIVSRHRHDFVTCACGPDSGTHVSVDGGNAYIRRGYGPAARWIEDDTDGPVVGPGADSPDLVEQACGAEHQSTGARCELSPGHPENHRGAFNHGIAQWPREVTPPNTIRTVRDVHLYTDAFGRTWKLTPTEDRDYPLIINLEHQP